MKNTRTFFVSCLCLTVAAPIAHAQTVSMAVGNSGQLHRTLAGTYGELFAEDSGLDPTAPVLAIEIDRPDQGASRLLVPGTDDSRIETDPRLFHDTRYDSVVLLWNSVGDGETHLEFATFDGSEWSQIHALEEDGAPASIAGGALVEVTHDAFDLDLGEGDPISLDRRVIHVLWRGGGELAAVKYAPLTFVEGHYVGWNNLVVLSEALLQAAEAGEGGEAEVVELTPALAGSLELRTADDGRSALAVFTDSRSHRIGTAAIIPQPLEVDVLGDLVRERILALADEYDPEDVAGFSDEIRAGIVIIGHNLRFNPAHVDYLAGQVAEWIRASEGSYGWDLDSLADDARELAIEVGNEVAVSSVVDPSDPDLRILTADLSGLLGGAEEPRAQVVSVRGRSDRPAPAIGDGPTTIHISRDGLDLLIAWQDEEAGQLHWVESRQRTGGTWSETFSLTLGESLSLEAAHELLARKIR